MANLPPSTSKEETQAQLEGVGAVGNGQVVQHDLFLTDAFSEGSNSLVDVTTDDPSIKVDMFDGWQNDDSYRQSRHLLSNASPVKRAKFETNLRENSLARQLSEKKDQPATIRLIRRRKSAEIAALKPGESQVPWINLIPPNTKFFLEQVNETREEKVQVIDTFGEWVAFFFGRKPEVYSYSGTLLNASNHDWKNEFQFNYDNFLRGSQAVKQRATMILQYDDVMVEGYMMNCSISQSALADKAVPFQFTLLVINRSSLNPIAALDARFARSGSTESEDMVFASLNAALDVTKTGGQDGIETFLLMREYFANRFHPAADVTVVVGTDLTSGESAQPGAASGATDAKRPSSSMSFGQSDSLTSSGSKLPPSIIPFTYD